MRDNFPKSLNETLSWEGGWANDPQDPGGATMKGVTLASFRRWKPNATKDDLRAISDAMLQKIYRADYWDKVDGDNLAAGVDLATFDYGVNSGPGTARKQLLKVVGGPDDETVRKLCARRLSSYQTFKTWLRFGKGWTRRIAGIEAKGVAWALAAKHDSPVLQQKLDDAAEKAKSTSKKQAGGAVATGGGGAAAAPDAVQHIDPAHADQIAAWIMGGLFVAGVVLAAYLIWRAHVNRIRAKAYAAEAEAA